MLNNGSSFNNKHTCRNCKKKNKDYGDAFAFYGSIGVIVRIGDKIQRLATVTKNNITLVESESLRDTLLDLHNYTAMAIMLLDKE